MSSAEQVTPWGVGPESFGDFLAATLGSRKWVIARRSPRLLARYDVFLPFARYQELKNEWALTVDWSKVSVDALDSYRKEVTGRAKIRIQHELARRWLAESEPSMPRRRSATRKEGRS